MRKQISIPTGVLMSLVIYLGVSSEIARADPQYNRCIRLAEGYAGNVACGEEALARGEAALTLAWKHAYASLDAKSKIALLQEQRAWIAYKDKSCRLFYEGEWGSLRSVRFAECRSKILSDRIQSLSNIDPEK